MTKIRLYLDEDSIKNSLEVEIILDQSKAQWLIDKTDNIEQKPDCGR